MASLPQKSCRTDSSNSSLMWLLTPLPGLNAASQAGEAQPQHQTIYLTASGEISIGRPLKKGKAVGKADILIFNEQSVSSIHANLHVGAGSTQQDGSFTHGSLSITGWLICTAQAPRCIHTLLSHRPPPPPCRPPMLTDTLTESISQSVTLSACPTCCCRRQPVWHLPHTRRCRAEAGQDLC